MKRAILNVTVIVGLFWQMDLVRNWLTKVVYDGRVEPWLGLLAVCAFGGFIQGCFFPNRARYNSLDIFWGSILAWLIAGVIALVFLNQVGLKAMAPKVPPPADEWTAIFTLALWLITTIVAGYVVHQLRVTFTNWRRGKAMRPYIG